MLEFIFLSMLSSQIMCAEFALRPRSRANSAPTAHNLFFKLYKSQVINEKFEHFYKELTTTTYQQEHLPASLHKGMFYHSFATP
jgi:hypothetical protein